MPISLPRLRPRSSFLVRLGLAAALVAAGDLIFYQYARWGSFVGLFLLGWLATTLIASPALRKRPGAMVCAAIAALLAGALVYDPGVLAFLLFWIAISMAALMPATARFDDGWRWAQRLLLHGVRSLIGPLTDMLKLRRARRDASMRTGLARALPVLALPLAGSAVILTLFAIANPVIGDAFSTIALPEPSFETIARVIFWGLLLTLVWGSLRPRRSPRLLATFDGSGDLALPGVSTLSVLLSLALFNALFALQNALDIAYLWGGLPLPEGMTLAEYAHRGAYPLIATALLAAGFVLVTLRPGSALAASPAIRRLLILWIAQNILLVGSTILRTLDYIDAYSLTELRIEALAWMVLVAIGLLLICWRMLSGKSASWLINTNLAAAGATLLAFCVVDSGAIAAAWNVRHAREVGGHGAALDLCYLNRLGASALVPVAELETHVADPGFAERVRAVRLQMMATVSADMAGGGWNPRDAERLARAQRLLGPKPPRPAPGPRDCDGRIVLPPPSIEPILPPLPQPAPPPVQKPTPLPTPLTAGPQ